MTKTIRNIVTCRVLLALLCIVLLTGCASVEKQNKPEPVPELRPGILQGYLPTEALPNSLALIPSPPAAGSISFVFDEEVNRHSLALRGTARWRLAIPDANLGFPQAADTFSCALDAPITEQDTPQLYMLMRRAGTDADRSTSAAKRQYKRPRPFMVNQESTCTPDDEGFLMKNGSYPSAHAAIGWTWALILSEIAPERGDAILARGRAFGQSRVICNVHWQSDVIEGRLVGAAAVARLHSDPAFRAAIEAAKAELAAVRAKGLKPTRDCEAEAGALATYPPLAPWPTGPGVRY
ncbi:MAG TPA: acid phosphatase [Syntrophobacteraceae bacterium]|nr:acid phosphatase [Syntrophobacteraceae bacterium]